jgi:hypothetical protein
VILPALEHPHHVWKERGHEAQHSHEHKFLLLLSEIMRTHQATKANRYNMRPLGKNPEVNIFHSIYTTFFFHFSSPFLI